MLSKIIILQNRVNKLVKKAPQKDGKYLSAVAEETKALAGKKECISALASFFAKAVPKK